MCVDEREGVGGGRFIARLRAQGYDLFCVCVWREQDSSHHLRSLLLLPFFFPFSPFDAGAVWLQGSGQKQGNREV